MGAPMKAPSPPPPPVASWQGFYVGADLGAARLNASQIHMGADGACGTDENSATCSTQATGAVAGGYAGYNWQSRYWVYGVEGDWTWTNLSNTLNFGAVGGGNGGVIIGKVNWLASARGRIGPARRDDDLEACHPARGDRRGGRLSHLPAAAYFTGATIAAGGGRMTI